MSEDSKGAEVRAWSPQTHKGLNTFQVEGRAERPQCEGHSVAASEWVGWRG